ncbi:chain length determinant protein [Pontibacter harenae]|uniref:chain length determinant protein n=1 Tax=Pontibacter harenae TaxID=2894083 RepID=UPI001E522517|nr:chain length determinant protein [Pontibacter harenae]MCC9166587.1 chain length determinant protein [Pontibacter harenae]
MHQVEEPDKSRVRDNHDEIDLAVVFEYVGRFFKRIGRGVGYVFFTIQRRIVMLTLLSLFGVALGFAAYKVTKPYYSGAMTFVLSDIRNEFVENQLDKLRIAVEEDNFLAISEMLDISQDAARDIKDMEFFSLDAERVAEDSILTGSPFRIELFLYNNNLFASMEPALANYLESNRYFSKLKRIKQREMESMISKLEEEIKSIDSVKTTVVSPRGPVNGFVFGQPIDPTNLYRESISMYQKQVDLEAELDQLDNIQIVNGFAPHLRPTGPGLLKYTVIGGLVAFVTGVILALILQARSRKKLTY